MPDDEGPPPVPPTDPLRPPAWEPPDPRDPVPPLEPPPTPPLPEEPPAPPLQDEPVPPAPPLPEPVPPAQLNEPTVLASPIEPPSAEILPSHALAPARAAIPKAAIIGALIAVTVAVGAVAFVKSVGPDAPADIATMVPADVLGFLRISVEPSGAQRADLRQLLGKLSAEKRAEVIASFDSLLAEIVDYPGGDFARDVRPWLGAQISVSAYKGDGKPAVVAAISVRDEAMARAFFTKVSEAGDPVVEVSDGVAYAAETAALITSFRAAASAAPLSENTSYARELQAAGGDGLAVVWVNGDQIAKNAGAIAGIFGGLATSIPGLGASAGSGVYVLRAEANGIALVGHQSGGPTPKQKPGRPRLLEGAPATILGGLSIFDIKGSIEQFGTAAAGAEGDPLAAASTLLGVVGLDLRKDVLAWLGGEVTFVATPLLQFGVVADVTDEKAYARTVAVLPDLIPGLGGTLTPEADGFTAVSEDGAFSVRKARGKVSIGFAESAVAARALAQQLMAGGGTTLGGVPGYRSALGASVDGTVFQVFLNLATLRPFLNTLGDFSFLESFEVGAIRVTVSDGGSDLRAVLTLAGT